MITGLSKQPDLFHVRGILQSTSLCFAFSDTKYVTESGPVAYYLILGETLVKIASGVVHFAAVRSEHAHS